ncbi:MAG: FAD-dependent oxidoreductase [Firmicutes bacterium]|nr:FAD-dependent oxidoreductase [Bacillota bacterium]
MSYVATDLQFDVIVVGGGTAGLIAALASARLGASTLLVERSSYLGGNAAVGMTWGGFFDNAGVQVIKGIPQELVDTCVCLGGGLGHLQYTGSDRWISSVASVDPEVFRYCALRKVQEAGCILWLHTTFIQASVEGNRVVSVELTNKSGRYSVRGKVVIDATGDADVAASIGVPWERGGDRIQQCLSSIFRISNVDISAFSRFMNTRVNTRNKNPWNIETQTMRDDVSYWCPWKVFPEEAQRMPKLFGVYYHGKQGDIFVNCNSVALNALNIYDLTTAEVELRHQAFTILRFLQKNIPGFASSFIAAIYPLGVRESRRIVGDYTLTLGDIMKQRSFPDVVAMGAYPPDVHDPSGKPLIDSQGNVCYQIPYRSLLARDISNLLVAGRCISATFEAQSAVRGIGPCMAMGESAGTAAALSAKGSADLRELKVQVLQETLIKRGAYLVV